MNPKLILFLVILISFVSCKTYQAKTYEFPKPVDTTDRPIEYQTKKVYELEAQGVYADNQFDGARLNDFKALSDSVFQATISPENTPINRSPYYAFKMWSDTLKHIQLELNYIDGRHRYYPKISYDGENWEQLPRTSFHYSQDSTNAILDIQLSPDTLWIAAQEVQNTTKVLEWCKAQASSPNVQLSSIGKSRLDRDLWCLDIHETTPKKKDIIVVLSRQHPPEVTGYFAMQAFIETVLEDNTLANAFRAKYRVLVYPLMNPDGVDLGHWRHNVGGIDLNRDWALYRQPEVKQTANHIAKMSKQDKGQVILGLDFHSTWKDIYYTNEERTEHIPMFKDLWLLGIHESIGEEINEAPSKVGRPVSKGWFITQFNAPGVTYEIGDATDRAFIKEKGRVSATEMMQLLVMRP